MDHERRQSPFAAFVRMRRGQLGLSQEQVARRAGEEFQGSYVAKLERDAVETPPRDRLRKLASALETPVADLARLIYYVEDEPLPEPPPPPRSRVLSDPALPQDIKDAVRHLVPDVPDDELYALARAMAAVQRQRREEAEAELGPPGQLPPRSRQARGQQSGDHGASEPGAAG